MGDRVQVSLNPRQRAARARLVTGALGGTGGRKNPLESFYPKSEQMSPGYLLVISPCD